MWASWCSYFYSCIFSYNSFIPLFLFFVLVLYLIYSLDVSLLVFLLYSCIFTCNSIMKTYCNLEYFLLYCIYPLSSIFIVFSFLLASWYFYFIPVFSLIIFFCPDNLLKSWFIYIFWWKTTCWALASILTAGVIVFALVFDQYFDAL